MDPFAIVKEFDVIKQVGVHFVDVVIVSSVDAFFLQLREKTLDTGIVVGTSASRHTASHVIGGKESLVARTGVLAPPVAVENGPFGVRIPSDRFPERAFHELGVDLLARRIANDFAVV